MARRLGLALCLLAAIAPPAGAQVLDPTFGSGGKVQMDLAPFGTFGQAVALQPDRKIVIAGYGTMQSGGNDAAVVVVRLLPDGAPDPGFGNNGVVVTNVGAGSDDYAVGLALGPGGVIYAAGSIDPPGTDASDFLLLRYTSGGV